MTTTNQQVHQPWCDTAECYIDPDPFDGYAAHYGQTHRVDVRGSDGAWRNEPSGEAPELMARPIVFDGRPGVEVATGGAHHVSQITTTTSGSVGISWLTTDEARAFAAAILSAVEEVES
jgi:hypothetical protein